MLRTDGPDRDEDWDEPVGAPRPDQAPILLSALKIHPDAPEPEPAPIRRDWMDASDQRFANRCLPLLVANQSGWLIPSTCTARIHWTGGNSPGSVMVWTDDQTSPVRPVSHFGHGVVTWTIPYLFRTSPGYNLVVRGPANYPKDGIYALDALVETDWFSGTFTMNWVMTRPRQTVTFAQGEPVCMVMPARRGEAEQVTPVIGLVTDHPDLSRRFSRWTASRRMFLSDLAGGVKDAVQQGWQREYFRGRDVGGEEAPEHQMRLRLRRFRNEHG
jgi:Family of unknown function (DUF6065)